MTDYVYKTTHGIRRSWQEPWRSPPNERGVQWDPVLPGGEGWELVSTVRIDETTYWEWRRPIVRRKKAK